MRVVIIVGVLWVALSVPLALVAGRALRSASSSPTLAEEVEAYLRERAPRVRRRPVGSAVGVLVAFLLAVTFGTRAGRELPDQAMVTLARWQELAFQKTTTTTAPEREVVEPPAPAGGAPDTAAADGDTDTGRRRSTSRVRAGSRPAAPTVTAGGGPSSLATEPGPTPTAGRTTSSATDPPPKDEAGEPAAIADTDGEQAARQGDEDGDGRSTRGRRSSRSGTSATTSTTSTTAPATNTTTSTTTEEPPPGTTTSSTATTTTTSTTSTTTTTAPPDEENYEQQGAGRGQGRPVGGQDATGAEG